jgi:O-antigen ligase
MLFFSRPLRALSVRNTLLPAALGIWVASIALAPTLEEKLILLAPGIGGAVILWILYQPKSWMYLFFLALLALPPLPAPGGDSGLHVAPIVAGLGLLIGLVRIQAWRRLHNPVTFWLCAFVAALLISTVFAAIYSGPQIAAGSLIRVLLFSLGAYVCLYTLVMNGLDVPEPLDFLRFLFVLAVAVAVFACLDFYFQWPSPAGYEPQFVWLDQGVYRRAQGLFYEASTLGNFCAFFLALILVCLFRPGPESPFPKPVLIASGIVLVSALILSYSRGSIVNVLITTGTLLWLRRGSVHFKIGRVLIAGTFVLLIAAVAVQLVLPSFSANYWSRIAASLQYVSTSPNGVLSGRLTNWAILLDFLEREPWAAVFGVGYKTLPYSDYVGARVIADNTYLQLLVETGIVGLTAFLGLNITILKTGLRAARSRITTTQIFGQWIFCFWAGQMAQMFSGDLITYWRVLPVYFWVLAIAAKQTVP